MLTVNRGSRGRFRRRPACVLLLFSSALATLLLPIRAHAELLGRASATVQYESNSNVFDLQSGPVPSAISSRPQADDYLGYGAELDGVYVFGRQNIYTRVLLKEFDYQRFKNLNHAEYELIGRFIWKLADSLDGIVGIARTHSMVPFLDITGQELTLSVSTQQKESATFDYKVNHWWMLEGGVANNKSTEPLVGAPNLQVSDTSGTATLNYMGIGRLSSGLSVSYDTGSYGGASNNVNPSYSQSQAGLVSTFKSGRTTYEGSVGYSRRSSSAGNDNASGLTGLFDFTYRETPKTTWRIKVGRAINSFIANTGSEIDTNAGAGVTWQASYKLSANLEYTYTYREYPGQGLNPPGSTRIDHEQYVNLSANYQPQRWILIRPYANVQKRASSLAGFNTNSTIFGVSVTVMTADQKTENSVPMETHWR